MKICFLNSGGGGNLKFLYECLSEGLIKNVELSVIADRECDAIKFAQKNGLTNTLLNYSRLHPENLRKVLNSYEPDIVVTNWHKIIDADTVKIYQSKMINLHYSLLPAFGSLIGIEPIKQAYERGCKFIGPTCHYVDDGVDTGKIISQAIFSTDIPYQDAIKKMFKMGCITLLNGIIQVSNTDVISEDIEKYNQNFFGYCPILKFNPEIFNNKFWAKIANL